MPKFSYKALREDGTTVEAVAEAADRGSAVRELSRRRLQVFDLKPAEDGSSSPGGQEDAAPAEAKGKASDRGGPVKLTSREVILFTEELADLLQAGMELEPALKLMHERSEASRVSAVSGEVRRSILEGKRVAQALRGASPGFGPLYCSLAEAGEAAGALALILRRQVTYLNTMNDLRNRVTTAMIYPSFLLLSGLGVTVLFVVFLIPRLMELIVSTGGDVPVVATVLMGSAGFLKQWGWVLLAGVAVAIGVGNVLVRRPAIRPVWDRWKLSLPLLGPLWMSRFHVQVLETLANILGNGLPLLKAVELVRNATPNLYLRGRLDGVVKGLEEGASLSRCLRKSEVFPPHLIDLLKIGEATGRMEEALEKGAERLDKQLGIRIERLSASIQPAIIVVISALVGLMAYVMISTIYETVSLMQTRR